MHVTRLSTLGLSTIAAVTLAMASPADAQDFTFKGESGNEWILFCPDENIQSAAPQYASNGNCRQIQARLDRGETPVDTWQEFAPLVGSYLISRMDDIYRYFAELGFRAPVLAEQYGGFRVNLGPARVMKSETGEGYDYGYYSDGMLWIGVDNHITADQLVDNAELLNTAAHELFHGVQAAYFGDEDPADWFEEGTANYVGNYYEALHFGTPLTWRDPRDFTRSLTDVTKEKAGGEGGYENDIFFAMLSRVMNGRGTKEPGLAGFGVATTSPEYLVKLLDSLGDASATLLDKFAKAVPQADPQGRSFYKLYPLVMRDLTYQPDHAGADFPFAEWKQTAPTLVRPRDPIEPGWSVTSPVYDVAPVATRFWRIDTSDFPEPGRMLVEVIMPEGEEENAESFHLAIHGVSYSRPHNPEAHNVGIIEKTGDDVYFAVSNIARFEAATRAAKFQIRLSWLAGGLCDYATIYAATNIDPLKRASAQFGLGGPAEFYDAFFLPPDAFLEEYGARTPTGRLIGDPPIQPDTGQLIIQGGGTSVGGRACTHHAASSGMLEAALLGDSMGFSAETEADQMADDLRALIPLVGALSEGQSDEDIEQLLGWADLFTNGSLLGTDPRDSSVVFSVFSPDLYGFYHGTPAFAETGPLLDGPGGWGLNTSGAINFILPGVKLTDLEEQRVYPAMTLSPASADGGLPLAGTWQGEWTDEGPIGEFRTLMAGRLTGLVTITKVTGASVEGTFSLRGQGAERHVLKHIEVSDEQRYMVEEDLSSGTVPIRVEGSFSAPTTITGTQIFKHMFALRSVARLGELE